jgi:hypothetical protein
MAGDFDLIVRRTHEAAPRGTRALLAIDGVGASGLREETR